MKTVNETNNALIEKTIGNIVADNYHAAGVFKEFGIDFCCGGGISLKKACDKKNLAPEDILSRLEALNQSFQSNEQNFNAWEPGFLIDYIIQTHHNFVRSKTSEITGYAAKVARVHGQRHPENVKIYDCFLSLSMELLEHLEAEEQRVFPLIREAYETRMRGEAIPAETNDALRKELRLMEDDHEGAGAMMREIRVLSNDFTPPADACATYRILYQNLAGFEEDLHKHVHLENNILFEKTKQLV